VLEPFGLGLPGVATLSSLGLITLASLALTLVRRARVQRRIAARIAARVAAVAGTQNEDPEPPLPVRSA
jgi:hypothetical protein